MNNLSSKARWLVSGLLLLNVMRCPAQPQTPQSVTPDTNSSPDYVCVKRGPDTRVWQRSVVQYRADGSARTNVQSYTELHAGACYYKDAQWVDSVEEIDLTATGAEALQGATKVQWAGNINTSGAVQVTSPSGQLFSSTVYGLSYRDSSTGTRICRDGQIKTHLDILDLKISVRLGKVAQ